VSIPGQYNDCNIGKKEDKPTEPIEPNKPIGLIEPSNPSEISPPIPTPQSPQEAPMAEPAIPAIKPPRVHTLESHNTGCYTILRSQVKAFFSPMKSRPDYKNIFGAFLNDIMQDSGLEPEVAPLVAVKAEVKEVA
jgi:hypothetical protein